MRFGQVCRKITKPFYLNVMPVIKAAIKSVRQDAKRQERNQHFRSQMKSLIKLMLGYTQTKDVAKATKLMPKVVSAIDACAKKNIIDKKNAANKKSRIARALAAAQAK